MNDAERDAWLREALRHAPDADATPPRDVSETILAQARAAARHGRAQRRGPGRRSRLAALWEWLARPRVAAAFATVMVATMVSLMWWDRPIDEAHDRRAKLESERAQSGASSKVLADSGPSAPQATAAPGEPADVGARAAAISSAAAAAPRNGDADAPPAAPSARRSDEAPGARAQPNEAIAQAPEPNAPAADAKEQTAGPKERAPVPNAPAPAENVHPREPKVPAPLENAHPPEPKAMAPTENAHPPEPTAMAPAAKEERKLAAAKDAAPVDRAAAKPAPLPRTEDRGAAAAPAQMAQAKKDSVANETGGGAARMAEAPAAAGALAKSAPAAAPPAAPPTDGLRPATPPGALRSAAEAPAPFGRQRTDEPARSSRTASGDGDAAKSAPAASSDGDAIESAPPATLAVPAAPAAPAAPAPPAAPSMRHGATTDVREKPAGAFSSPPSEGSRDTLVAAQRRSAAPAPLAPILSAIASDPARWSRSTASGSVVALDSGWRDWLAQLDAAASGRWQRSDAAAFERERDTAGTTLRLHAADRPSAVVRLDGTTVRVDGVEPGERWQATLPAPAAERLRATAESLAP